MSEQDSEATVESTNPTPKDAAEAANKGREGEPPEQTIVALRAALSRANSEAKEFRLKAQEYDQIKQAQMSDLERAEAQAKEYEQAAAKAQAEALRWRIAAKYGISDEDAETFLTGSDEESLTRQAERLAALSSSTSTPTTPKPDRSQGGSGEALALNGDGIEATLRAKLGIA